MSTPTDSFPALVQRFFGYIRAERDVSFHTVAAYRDTFRLLLRFIAERRRISIDHITLDAFCPDNSRPPGKLEKAASQSHALA
jgi:site-specific recombinase XerC